MTTKTGQVNMDNIIAWEYDGVVYLNLQAKATIEFAQRVLNDIFRLHGLRERGWTFDWDMRSRKRIGATEYNLHGTGGRILLATRVIPFTTRAQVLDTVLHEVAHALVGHAHAHNIIWKTMAQRIGGSGERVAHIPEIPSKYRLICTACNKDIGPRHRRTDLSRYAHRPCPQNAPAGTLVFQEVQ